MQLDSSLTSQTYQSERAVLGCLSLYCEQYGGHVPDLSLDLFDDDAHKDICRALQKAYKQSSDYDVPLICSHLADSDHRVELYHCGEVVNKTTPFNEHFRVLMEAAKQRFVDQQIRDAISTGNLNASRLREITDIADTAYTTELSKPKYTRLSDIDSSHTDWLWYPYIPLGKITLMTADPGTGKTFLALYLASQVSAGRPFYGESDHRKPEVAVYQTAEDGIADTIKPRLECMKPNFDNIYIYDESEKGLRLSDDKQIEQIMIDLHPKLMIFDPLQAYLGADVDMNRANEVRPVLGRIGHLAEKYQCAVIFIMHHSKASQNAALHRALGSMDIPAVARSMLILGKDPEQPQRKVICHEKSSLAPHGKSILFQIEPQFGGVTFSGYSELKADDILNVPKFTRKKPSQKRDALIDDIMELFGENDYIKIDSIKRLCEHLECSQNTLYRARDEIGIKSAPKGYGKEKVTYWILPDADFDTVYQAIEQETADTQNSV